MELVMKCIAVYILAAIIVGPVWNISCSKEPWLTISGLFGLSGFVLLVIGAACFVWQIA